MANGEEGRKLKMFKAYPTKKDTPSRKARKYERNKIWTYNNAQKTRKLRRKGTV